MSLVVIGVSDFKVCNVPDVILVTYSLGSCIGITIHDPIAKVGGMLHFMLPDSNLDEEKALKNPAMFADTGIPVLFKSAYQIGAIKQRMKIVVVGGSQILDQKGFFSIGKKNYLAMQKIFSKNNIVANYEDIGGNVNRTLRLEIQTGNVYIKTSGQGEIKI